MKMTNVNEAEETRINFMEALNIFKDAFRNLNEYAGHCYIYYEDWCPESYPFNKPFDEMIPLIDEWVDDCTRQMADGVIHGSYEVSVYASNVIPEWQSDDNLWIIEVEGVVLYDWYIEYVVMDEENPYQKEDRDIRVFNQYIQNELCADMTSNLYEYAKARGGVIKVEKYFGDYVGDYVEGNWKNGDK